jgi:regulation of enolase protein 1 (concanavalin A-like superfamily)
MLVMNLISKFETGKIPDGFSWLNEPGKWSITDGILTMIPGAETDFYRSPDGDTNNDSGCLVYSSVSGDFTAVVHVEARLVGFGDAGALTVRKSPTQWAKLCMERSPTGDFNIVSVVTDGSSDDCNGELLETPECFLRITRKGTVFAMHHSLDGILWRFARNFTRDYGDTVMLGFHAQAPFVGGCSVDFDSFSIKDRAVDDFRSGK